MASSTTRRHSRDDPREDVGEEVRVGIRVRVGAVECQLKQRGRQAAPSLPRFCGDLETALFQSFSSP